MNGEQILKEIQQLSFEEKTTLISLIADMLIHKPSTEKEARNFYYGMFSGPIEKMSKEEDFKIAEWHLNEEKIDGD
ncbi:hypothetical protein FJZ31_21140 [Candidatus Poribacteria bacterium]|nr:hypothetical protein [Candidatus Poribacteria bacterium]